MTVPRDHGPDLLSDLKLKSRYLCDPSPGRGWVLKLLYPVPSSAGQISVGLEEGLRCVVVVCGGGSRPFSPRLFGECSGWLTACGPGSISLLRILGLIFVIKIIRQKFSTNR